jgi:hypothetical protein
VGTFVVEKAQHNQKHLARIAGVIGTTVVLAADASAADFTKYMGAYFCTATAGSGIYYDDDIKSWVGSPFKHDKVQYIMKVRDTGKRIERSYATLVKDKDGKEEIKGVPDKYPIVSVWVKEKGKEDENPCATAPEPDLEPSIFGDEQIMNRAYLGCNVVGTSLQFNLYNLRFQAYFDGGFLRSTKGQENTDTPFIFVGTCDKID